MTEENRSSGTPVGAPRPRPGAPHSKPGASRPGLPPAHGRHRAQQRSHPGIRAVLGGGHQSSRRQDRQHLGPQAAPARRRGRGEQQGGSAAPARTGPLRREPAGARSGEDEAPRGRVAHTGRTGPGCARGLLHGHCRGQVGGAQVLALPGGGRCARRLHPGRARTQELVRLRLSRCRAQGHRRPGSIDGRGFRWAQDDGHTSRPWGRRNRRAPSSGRSPPRPPPERPPRT